MMSTVWKNNFWLLCIFAFGVVSFVTLGFIKDLYFWRDDYALIYQLQKGTPFGWPYHAVTFVYYLIYFFFKGNPFGYFAASFASYVLLAFTLCCFIYKISRGNKPLAFLAGTIFSLGLLGTESQFMVGIAFAGNLYLTGVLLSILSYQSYFEKVSLKRYLVTIIFYTTLLLVFPYRTHSLPLLLFISDLYFASNGFRKIHLLREISFWTSFLKRFSTFFLLALFIFQFIPGIASGQKAVGIIFAYFKNFNFSYLATFLSDLGNFVVFSSVQEKVSGVPAWIFGLVFLILIYFFFFRGRDKLGGYLSLGLFFSYLIYHLNESATSHWTTHRYLFFSYPFFAAIVARVILKIALARSSLLKNFLMVLTSVYISTGLYQVYSLRQEFMERSIRTKKFFSDLSRAVKSLNGRTLFYFDVVSDVPQEAAFWEILRVGIYPVEVSLASFYGVPLESVKIASDYDTFLEIERGGEFKEVYAFFYNRGGELIDISSDIKDDKKSKNYRLDLSKSELYLNYVDENILEKLANGDLIYKSRLVDYGTKTRSLNGLLKIATPEIEFARPLQVNILMSVKILTEQITRYPYFDALVFVRPKDISLESIHYKKERESLIFYLLQREKFKKEVVVKTSGDEDLGKGENVADGNLKSNWLSSKFFWSKNHVAWIDFQFLSPKKISEIRWLADDAKRFPISYQYLTSSDGKDWKTVAAFRREETSKEYVIDRFEPIVTKYLKMLITETEEDFPSISEIEILEERNLSDSRLADFLLTHPLVEINDADEMREMVSAFSQFARIKAYPISDKYLDKERSVAQVKKILLDGRLHEYSFVLSPAGTKLSSLILEFPNIPLEAKIESIMLTAR